MERSPPIERVRHVVLAALLLGLFFQGVRGAWLMVDDAWISFRYADHLVRGLGLVWNPGERVEGYTNFLWVMLMAAVLGLGGDPEWWSCALGIASGVAVLCLTWQLGVRSRGLVSPWVWLAPAALVLHRSFLAWCTGGLETMATAALVLAALVAHLRERERDGASAQLHPSALLLGLATLCRPDAGLFALVLLAVWSLDEGRRLPRATALVGPLRWALVFAAPLAVHLAWRRSYYGAWLPNTFHAKVNGLWFEQGLRYLGLFVLDHQLWWILPSALVGLALTRSYAHVLLASCVLAQLAYVAAIGGGVFEFRLLVVILAPLYWLWSEGLAELVARARARGAATAWSIPPLAAALALAALVGTARASRIPALNATRHGVDSLPAVRGFGELRRREGRALRELIDAGVLPDDLHWATGGAGAIPYYTRWTTTDRHGLSDRAVARTEVETRTRVGHEHWATDDYLRERGVEVVELLPTMLLLHPPSPEARAAVAAPGRQLHVYEVRGSFGTRYLFFASVQDHERVAARFARARALQ